LKAGVQFTKHPFQCNIFFKVFWFNPKRTTGTRMARIYTDSKVIPGRISIFVQPKRCVPKGHFENSPAFERRGLTVSQQVPQGRLKKRLPRRSLGEDGFFQPSLRDSGFSQPVPALKCRAIFDGSFGTERLLKN
jgi:hypothetical protein